MAKGSRSNRKKALRTVRREKVKATWQEEADKKRFEVVQQCAEAPPVQLSAGELERIAEAKAAPPRGRGGGPEAMDADGGGGKGPRGAKGKGKKGSKKGVVVGGKKGRAKKVGVLAKVSGNQFHKKKRK
ncbi:hypothetical protein MNEG_0364 [Monoraphidium neglectum]|uniref:Uncharacterized protein n=1 Tax=Monoraphidium neglectum TaxID=145388 RepID=A0A0D2MYS3_9CHLO|nr:hypothetical protein MNEG_0364 [Monoraphidium neglectum]KIZ07595.1 hypothetical protein MNEG_0364 [Monoraphidium neglectum]|eukprot:XP_013906614.1 hypothetical protein MNEG_0364 [Monoraphidium neglectum]